MRMRECYGRVKRGREELELDTSEVPHILRCIAASGLSH